MVKEKEAKEQYEFVTRGLTYEMENTIADLEFVIACLPDLEACPDDQIEFDLFMAMETLIVRVGYPRFEQIHDQVMRKVWKYYG